MRSRVARPYAPDEIAADRAVHIVGLTAGGFGAAALIAMALYRHAAWWSVVVYAACLLAMLGSSAAYNLARDFPRRDLLRRFDHAAIFLMIAGTYTPFTTRALHGTWALGMTAWVWSLALVGAFVKLRYPRRLERVDVLLYLGLGWSILVAWEPLRSSIDATTAALIIAGGVLYTIGAGVHAWRTLRFQNAIWHGFVLVAAACHFLAVMRGVLRFW